MGSGHPGQNKSLQDLISMEKSWVWWCLPVISAMIAKVKQRDRSPEQPEQKARLISNISRAKWAGGEAQAVEGLLNMGEGLISNSSTAK
jgi:hypothetical protein